MRAGPWWYRSGARYQLLRCLDARQGFRCQEQCGCLAEERDTYNFSKVGMTCWAV